MACGLHRDRCTDGHHCGGNHGRATAPHPGQHWRTTHGTPGVPEPEAMDDHGDLNPDHRCNLRCFLLLCPNSYGRHRLRRVGRPTPASRLRSRHGCRQYHCRQARPVAHNLGDRRRTTAQRRLPRQLRTVRRPPRRRNHRNGGNRPGGDHLEPGDDHPRSRCGQHRFVGCRRSTRRSSPSVWSSARGSAAWASTPTGSAHRCGSVRVWRYSPSLP